MVVSTAPSAAVNPRTTQRCSANMPCEPQTENTCLNNSCVSDAEAMPGVTQFERFLQSSWQRGLMQAQNNAIIQVAYTGAQSKRFWWRLRIDGAPQPHLPSTRLHLIARPNFVFQHRHQQLILAVLVVLQCRVK